MKVLTDYSLFSEYHKNKDFASAVPYGWKVIEAQPTWFSKWIYYKMEECFWALHDSTSSSTPEMVKSVQDTILYFYDLAIKYRDQKIKDIFKLEKLMFQNSGYQNLHQKPSLNMSRQLLGNRNYRHSTTIDLVNCT